MKKIAGTKTMNVSKREAKRAMNTMKKELEEILNTFDYSNYEITIYHDEINHVTIIPKPVFALSFVNEPLRNWLENEISQYPEYMLAVA